MRNAQEILDAIRKLPADEQAKIRRQLAVDAVGQSDAEKRMRKLQSLCGSVDIGGFLVENPDREWMYGDDR